MKFQIENYDTMTAEEKVAALEAYEPDMSGFVSKSMFDKTSSELAAAKKSLKERMTEDELAKAKAAEDMAAIRSELEQLRAEKAVSENAAKFLSLGYDQKLAHETAEAMIKGELDTVFKNHAKFLSDREKALRVEILKETPAPPPGPGEKTVTKEEFSKLNLAEKAKFAQENPELYKEFYGGN